MQRTEIALPVFAMMGLTALVWLRMYWLRIGAWRRGRLSSAYMRTAQGTPPPEQVVAASRHFSNLFEVPVLFYVTCLLLAVLARVDGVFLAMAWLFVLCRVVHAAIHLTYNNPYHRFASYVAGCVVLGAMVVRLAGSMVSAG